jgi:hypothetical protein
MSLFAPFTCDHERAENAAPAVASADVLRKNRRVIWGMGKVCARGAIDA